MGTMSFLTEFESHLPTDLRKQFLSLKTPFAIQQYLDSLTYNGEERDRSPLNVMLDGQGHCLDGGFLASLALWQIGFKPLVIDIVPDPGVDDDHVLALYQIEGRWGALAKTNYINLGFREPVYKNLREQWNCYAPVEMFVIQDIRSGFIPCPVEMRITRGVYRTRVSG